MPKVYTTGTNRHKYLKTARRVVQCLMLHQDFKSCNQYMQRLLFLLAVQHSTTIDLNTFSEEIEVGVGGILQRYWMYDVFCRFNHSCVPNLEHTLDDNDMINCITLRPIKEGEQLFINYLTGKTFNSADDKREYIQQQWNFVCKCEICQ